MAFDPKINRNNKDAIGDPGDSLATNATEPWTIVSLLKGLYNVLANTGITVTGGTLATAAKQDTGNTSLASMDAKLTTLNFNTDTLETAIGITAETAPLTDTASSGLNGRLQRVAQNLTSILGKLTAGAASISKAEDVASADGDVGVPAMMVRKATPANTSGTDGDYEFLQGSAGRLWVDASGVSLTVGTHAVTLAAGATAIAKAEDVASADADVGVPAMAVRKATPANTSGTDGDYEMLQMSAGRLWVDASGVALTVNSHAVTNAGTFAVQPASATAPVSTMNSASANSGVNSAMAAVFDDTSPTAITENSFGFLRMSANRNLYGTIRDAAGNERGLNINANNAASVAFDQTTSGTTNGVVPHASAATGGIASTSRIVSAAASTNATSAKASAGRVYAIQGYNASGSVRYLKLYNKASAPTVGTDTPVKTIPLPPGVGFAFDWPHGYSFATGIAYALTTGSADADTGALTAGDVLGLNVDYT